MKKFRLPENSNFYIPAILELIFISFLIILKRKPLGHDGFVYFSNQYYFLNNVVANGEIPQWIPFLTHGSVASWAYLVQAGLFQNVLCLTGSMLSHLNFIPLFYAGIFIDEMLLLIGTWQLAKRFFNSAETALYISLCVMGTCVFISQPWWNFHLYYALPLMLSLAHSFFDTGKWRYFALAGNLLAVQMLGNLFYFFPVVTLTIFLYFLFYFMLNPKEILSWMKQVKWGVPFVAAVGCFILSSAFVYLIAQVDVGQMISATGRGSAGQVDLNSFLTYAGNTGFSKWKELVLGISPALDFTLYIGILSVPLALIGILGAAWKRTPHLCCLMGVLILFSSKTFISTFFYYAWPTMKCFRHLALISPLIKYFLCFAAGAGFEYLFVRNSPLVEPREKRRFLITTAVVAAMMLGVSIMLLLLSRDYAKSSELISGLVSEGLFTTPVSANKLLLLSRLFRTFIFSFGFLILILLMAWARQLPNSGRKILIGAVLIFHAADVYSYKMAETDIRTVSLSNKQYEVVDFHQMPYYARRDGSETKRDIILGDLQKLLNFEYGSVIWTTYAFLFKDDLHSLLKVELLLSPLNDFVKAYTGKSPLIPFGGFHFPDQYPAALKMAGSSEDKIQFFSDVYGVESDEKIAAAITNSNYGGDILFLSSDGEPADQKRFLKWPPDAPLSGNRRLKLPYQVDRFDSNRINVSVDSGDQMPAWMFYSDVWHSAWRATVNGKPVQVYKANLAYKAISLDPGPNKVSFYFKRDWVANVYFIFGLNSLFWVVLIVSSFFRNSFKYENKNSNSEPVPTQKNVR